MSKEISIVYVLYLNSMEQMYAFESKEDAEVIRGLRRTKYETA